MIGCNGHSNDSAHVNKKIDKHWLDSIITSSDSNYVKPYRRSDFADAFFYLNKKDSSVCQLMKDSAGEIRQVIIAKKNVRAFFAQYYTNGQLQADLLLDEFGQFHNSATYYYQNGMIQSKGYYVHGFKSGKWENYNENGKLTGTETFDENGKPQTNTKD